MAICTACGAASALGVRLCAACGQPFAEPGFAGPQTPPGPGGGIGAVEDAAGPLPDGRWGSGVPYEPRGAGVALARLLADWRPALRALLAPTALLVAVAVLLALAEDGLWPPRTEYGGRFRVAVALVLTVFGAPLHDHEAGDADGLVVTSGLALRGVPVLLAVGWLALLAWRLRAGRGPAGSGPGRGAVAAAARTAAVSGVAGLLLGLVGRVDLRVSALRPEQGHRTVGTDLPTVVVVAAVAAGLVALAVYGGAALRARAGRWADLLAPAARAAAVPVGLATVAALAVAVSHPDLLEPWVYLPVAANGGLLLLGLGSGATVRLTGGDVPRMVSLFDLGGVGGQWRWALLPAVAGALVLGRAVYRRGLGSGDRLRLAVLYAVLMAVPMLAGLSMRYRFAFGTEPGAQQEHGYSVSLTAGTVLVAVLLWSALGAFALPALFAAVRPAPAAPGAPPGHGDGAAEVSVRPADDAHGAVEPDAAPPPYGAEVLDWRGRS